jgi:DNA polymerase III subunit delta
MKKSPPDAAKSQTDFWRRLKAGETAPLYLFEGTELHLRNKALRSLEETLLDPGVRDFNLATFSVASGKIEEALGLARQYPMISPRRMVIIQDFESISDDRQLELLKDYLTNPAESSVVIFVTAGMDNRRNIATMLRKTCQVVQFQPFDDQQATQWVRDYAAQSDCLIDQGAASWLVATVGVDLTRLAGEMEKLINHARGARAGRPVITRDEIDLLVRYSREHSNFELTDAIIAGDRTRALRLLERLYANSDESVQSLSLMIIGAIAVNLRRLLTARDLMRLNLPNSEVAQAVGMSPYAVTYLNEKARRLDDERLISSISLVARTDLALKSSLATPRLLMEVLVCDLTRTIKPSPERPAARSIG